MIKRKIVGLSMQPEDAQLLEAIAAEVDLTKSELVRRMLYKMSFDDKMKAIIKRGNVIALYNAHSVKWAKNTDETEEKKDPGHDSREDSSSLDPTKNLPPYNQLAKRADELWEEWKKANPEKADDIMEEICGIWAQMHIWERKMGMYQQ